MCRARSLSLPPCWLPHPRKSRNRCLVSFVEALQANDVLKYVIYFLFLFSFFFYTNRWASFPADSVHACQPGRKDHWHAAGDWQLRTVAHVGVSWISALKGTWIVPWKKVTLNFSNLVKQVSKVNHHCEKLIFFPPISFQQWQTELIQRHFSPTLLGLSFKSFVKISV